MIPEPEEMPIAVRGYGVPRRERARASGDSRPPIGPSDLALIFDIETTVDAAQQNRVGAYQLRKGGVLKEAGLFYDPESLDLEELDLVRRYAAKHDLELMTDRQFVEKIFFGVAYRQNATIIGFNLPFDLSRLAVDHGSARGSMRPGFTFAISTNWWQPRLRIKHLSARESLISFADRKHQATGRSGRKRGRRTPIRRGYFVDVKTLAASLTGASYSLSRLSRLLQTEHKKVERDDHGEELTAEYLDYLALDVQVTYECYEQLSGDYADYELAALESAILSEASIGKACLGQMNVAKWRDVQPDFAAKHIGVVLSAYYGGRAEVKIRRTITRVLYVDFLSMYPSVCALMGIWQFVIARGIREEDATKDVRQMLAGPPDLFDPATWRNLCVLVRVRPEGDIFPVRAKYDEVSYAIGLNYLTSAEGLWYTLADVLASVRLTGKSPEVLEARRFVPLEPQEGLQPIKLMGREEWTLDPYTEDFYKRLIELRSEVKKQMKSVRATGNDLLADRLDAMQQGLKILANATSYGIFVELNVSEHLKRQAVTCYGPSGKGFFTDSKGTEKPGPYFHPLLATLITGAARLMLALLEDQCVAQGLGWALCDTDSMAIAKPEGMSESEFLRRANRIIGAFQKVSPYSTSDPLLKIEDANFKVKDGELTNEIEPLYCLAISAKRYVLFNLDNKGRPVIRKASGHGLGHLLAPYEEKDAPRSIPKPATTLREIGVPRWQYDVWYRVILAALEGHPDQVPLDDLPGFTNPAVSRYAATTTSLLSWFKQYNKAKQYRERVRPFGFLLAFQAKRPDRASDEDLPRAIAPFDKNPAKAAAQAFDRETGEAVPASELKTYAEALAQYHLHPESKFLNGDFVDKGATGSRHIQVSGIDHIGKEANRWEEQFFLGEDPDAQIVYGKPAAARRRLEKAEREAWRKIGVRTLARESGVSVGEVSVVIQGQKSPRKKTLQAIRRAARSSDY